MYVVSYKDLSSVTTLKGNGTQCYWTNLARSFRFVDRSLLFLSYIISTFVAMFVAVMLFTWCVFVMVMFGFFASFLTMMVSETHKHYIWHRVVSTSLPVTTPETKYRVFWGKTLALGPGITVTKLRPMALVVACYESTHVFLLIFWPDIDS